MTKQKRLKCDVEYPTKEQSNNKTKKEEQKKFVMAPRQNAFETKEKFKVCGNGNTRNSKRERRSTNFLAEKKLRKKI